jgi:hypothetical protein
MSLRDTAMNRTPLLLACALAALTFPACKVAGYDLPAGGVSATDESGSLQMTATKLKTSKKGFTAEFAFVNQSDNGLLVPLGDFEASWGDQLGAVAFDTKDLRKNHTVVMLRGGDAVDSGLFAGTGWVTGGAGEPPRGEALFLRPRSRTERTIELTCTTVPQPGAPIVVRLKNLYAGDEQGAVASTVATGVQWALESSAKAAP